MNFWKKLGNLVMAFLPLVVSYAIQFACAFGVMFVCSFVYGIMVGLNSPELATDAEAMTNGVLELYTENTMSVVVLYQVLGVIVFGLWYFFGMKQKKLAVPKAVRNVPTIAGAIILGVGAQFAISGVLQLLMDVVPEVMQSYVDLMEAAGLGEMTVATILATVILAPIGEEILCRGITFRLAKKVSNNFWVANIIQALAFGILHGNLVQGTYAFILGLILGVLYERYQSLYVPMLVHLVLNFSGMFLVEAVLGNFEPTVLLCSVVSAIGIAAVVVGMLMMQNRVKNEEGVVNGAEQ